MAPISVLGSDESDLLSKSRALVADYATQLQGALQEAMQSGGPVAAIAVCKDVAPRIASELSESSGATVGRTSLRYRNPANAPAEWQSTVLASFDGGSTEFSETTDSGEFRYMKPIPTGALCLTCHGETLVPEIAQAIDTAYPDDLARGYQAGDIRGAFSVTWPPPDAD